MKCAPTLSRILITLVLSLPLHAQVVEETGSLLQFLGGSEPGCAYDNWFSHIVEGIASPGYNYYGPERLDPQTNGFGDYERLYSNTYGTERCAQSLPHSDDGSVGGKSDSGGLCADRAAPASRITWYT